MFDLEQGIKNPRYDTVNWTYFESFETLAEAKKEAKKARGLWRVVQTKVVWTKPIDQPEGK